MRTLIIYQDSFLDNKFLDMWEDHADPRHWADFIKSLDVNITSVSFRNQTTTIEFVNEAHKTWFIMKWS
jgi:hypothetical protein